ncbi:hypothetical protein [Dyadobacter jiangsuensis]|uniref:hypothetical protein n=1 Tax=Dyadobacter jiangsuensis TaxID=1591085 RepID=UPI000D0DE405|nr:hypothetical protein [Dyadobacter jiangsuensis]
MCKWNEAYAKRPQNELCSRQISIDIIGRRCVYINDYRVQGGKPYISENLPTDTRKTTVREVLEAFSVQEIQAYLEEKIAVNAYCAGLRNYRDAETKGDA